MAKRGDKTKTVVPPPQARVIVDGLETPRILKRAARRIDAALFFIRNSYSISEMAALDEWIDVAKYIPRWASVDNWLTRRAHFNERWAARAREKLASQLVQDRLELIDDLQKVQEVGLKMLLDTELARPKSWEGVARALTDVTRTIEELRGTTLPQLLPAASEEEPTDVGMSKDELQAAARQVLQMRRGAVIDVTATPTKAVTLTTDVVAGSGDEGTREDGGGDNGDDFGDGDDDFADSALEDEVRTAIESEEDPEEFKGVVVNRGLTLRRKPRESTPDEASHELDLNRILK